MLDGNVKLVTSQPALSAKPRNARPIEASLWALDLLLKFKKKYETSVLMASVKTFKIKRQCNDYQMILHPSLGVISEMPLMNFE
jgi:hypothetical protein